MEQESASSHVVSRWGSVWGMGVGMTSSPDHPKQTPGTELALWAASRSVYPCQSLSYRGQHGHSWEQFPAGQSREEAGRCLAPVSCLPCYAELENQPALARNSKLGKIQDGIQREQAMLGKVFLFIRLTPHHSKQL